MKCPDCGMRMTEITVDGILAHRCFKCGGFWADSEAVNRLTVATLATWRRISVDPQYFSGGGGLCPLDNMKLERYMGESIPMSMTVKRCPRCGKWWFAGDTLHQYKPAQEAKFNYYRMWGIMGTSSEWLLPLAAVVVLLSGLVIGIVLIETRQQVAVPAKTLDLDR